MRAHPGQREQRAAGIVLRQFYGNNLSNALTCGFAESNVRRSPDLAQNGALRLLARPFARRQVRSECTRHNGDGGGLSSRKTRRRQAR